CTSAKTPPRPTHPDRGEKPTQPNRLGGFALGTGSRTGRRQVCRHESYHTITPSMRLVGKQPCRIRSNFVGLGDSRSPPLTEATSGSDSATYIIDIIRSGWNTSGSRYYPADVLERDIPQIYGPGTHMYIDHPSRSEQQDRPERSLVNLAAVFVDTPWPVREDDGTVRMRTTVRVFAPWRKMLAEMWPYIGVSINGYGEGKHGEREGHRGFIV